MCLVLVWTPQVFGESYHVDLRDGFDAQVFTLFGGSDPSEYCSPSAEGLRVVFSANKAEVASAGAAGKLVLQGDFSITAAFQIREIAVPGGGNGAGLSMAIADAKGQVASLQCVVQPDGVRRLVAHWGVHTGASELKHEVRMLPTTAENGTLRITRRSGEIRYAVLLKGSKEYKEIHRTVFSRDEIVCIHLAAQSGEWWPCMVDVTWEGAVVKADEILTAKQWAKTRTRLRRGLRVGSASTVSLLLIVAATAWHASRRHVLERR